jgi:hypothetical protein
MIPGQTPDMSIIIASPDASGAILECLAALEPQRGPAVEILVADGSDAGAAERVRAKYPWARVVSAPGARSLPRLRGLGMAAATAPIVGVLDAWCIPGPDWIADAVRLHRERPELVIGGGVTLGAAEQQSWVAWATYLFDYWEFVPPFATGPAGVLPGNNITYKREALPDAATLQTRGFWKAFTNARLKASGHGLWSSAGLTVQLRRRLPLGRFFRSRYHHGRSYAAMRVESAGWGARMKWALVTPGLPLLFLSRQIRGLASKPGARGRFIVCAPLLLAFHASWAWGELSGYLLGAGRSHDAIRF